MKQLDGDDALLLFCSFNSTVLLGQDKLLCSLSKPGGNTQESSLNLSLSLTEGMFSWQRAAEEGNQPGNRNTRCLLKHLIKNWSNPLPKMALQPDCRQHVEYCRYLPMQVQNVQYVHQWAWGESCSDLHRSDSSPYTCHPIWMTWRMMKNSSAAIDQTNSSSCRSGDLFVVSFFPTTPSGSK